ncbi:15268_t:CDS:2 [Cetraspora pellucida]|uniref:15268_t:CDS:1 n=1 Tax=Cetraspora pellucida TaxID=1433469 RepID=A0A9N9A833_9GLOM|nr:15268_t:CDS:2 [Cetraspora pellucida]
MQHVFIYAKAWFKLIICPTTDNRCHVVREFVNRSFRKAVVIVTILDFRITTYFVTVFKIRSHNLDCCPISGFITFVKDYIAKLKPNSRLNNSTNL